MTDTAEIAARLEHLPCAPKGPYPQVPCWITTPMGRFLHDPERPDRTAEQFGLRLREVTP